MINEYLHQISLNNYRKLTNQEFENIEEEGWIEQLEEFYKILLNKNNFLVKTLNLSPEDKKGLINMDEKSISLFNQLDIKLKEKQKYPFILLDFIDYDNGEVYIYKFIKMINEENSDMMNRTYQVPSNIVDFLKTKTNDGWEIANNLISGGATYTNIKKIKHEIENGQFKTDWTPILQWINGVLDRDRGMLDNQKRTPMEIGVENRFKKTHFKNDTLTPLSGKKQHVTITEQQAKLVENYLKEQNKTPCQTPETQFHIKVSGKEVSCKIDLPIDLDLTEEEAKILDTNIHNLMEIALAKYFKK